MHFSNAFFYGLRVFKILKLWKLLYCFHNVIHYIKVI